MSTSSTIYAIVAWLESTGVTVHLHAFDLPCAGMYRSETREVFLNAMGAEDALSTIAHEAGHVVGYSVRVRPESYQRERQAFVYGWRVLRWFGGDIHVTRKRWIDDERRRRQAEDVTTEHLFRLDAGHERLGA